MLTGWLPTAVTSATRYTLQNTHNGYTTNFNETKIAATTNTTINGVAFRYTNVAWPTSGYHVLTVNYYDDYNYPNAPTITASIEGEPVYYNTTTVKPKGLTTGIWTRVLQTSTTYANELSYSFYDKKARPIRTYSKNFLGGYTYTDSKLDFIGKPFYTITRHKRLSGSTELKTKDAFTYSQQGRLLTQTHQINDGEIELIASNTYDELGQLVSKKIGNNVTTPTQKVDYTYNIRGWLKGINDISSLTQSGAPKDLFALKINYNTITSGISGVNALYNGNIAETQWATNSDNGVVRTYGYQYDNLNRLKAGIYKKGTVLNVYNESMDYDKNGNIMHLTRYGSVNDNTQTLIDNLTYNYANTNQSNQLISVDDAVANNSSFIYEFKNTSGIDYSYDTNGNMTSDLNKGITSVLYNHLNMPTKITVTGSNAGTVDYVYSADRTKLQKKKTQGGSTTTTDYIGNYVYENNVLKQITQPEGYIEPDGSGWQYVYRLTDIWGNTRITFADDDNSGSVNSSEIRREQNYYPFGMEHKGYNGGMYGVKNNLKTYQKQEFTEDLGLNTHGWKYRVSDPAIGRFWQIDPLAEDYTYNSTYAFQENKLGVGIELEGLEVQWFMDKVWHGVLGQPRGGNMNTHLDNTPTSTGPTKNITGNYLGDALYKLAGGETVSKAIDGDAKAQFRVISGAMVSMVPGTGAKPVASMPSRAKAIVNLGNRAKQIHSALPKATQTRTTTAVVQVTNPDGSTSYLVASSEKRLRPAKRAALNSNETAVVGEGHAEVTAINSAANNGQTVQRVGASRPICEGCEEAINTANAEAVSPLKK